MHTDKQTQKYKHTKPGINWTTRNNTSTTYLKSHDGDILTTMNFLYIVTIFEIRVEFSRFLSIYNFYYLLKFYWFLGNLLHNIRENFEVLGEAWFATKKRDLISSERTFVCELPRKLSNSWRLRSREIRNITRIPNLGRDTSQRPVSPP